MTRDDLRWIAFRMRHKTRWLHVVTTDYDRKIGVVVTDRGVRTGFLANRRRPRSGFANRRNMARLIGRAVRWIARRHARRALLPREPAWRRLRVIRHTSGTVTAGLRRKRRIS